MKNKNNKKKTRHEGNEGTVAFWLYMKALYKDIDWARAMCSGKGGIERVLEGVPIGLDAKDLLISLSYKSGILATLHTIDSL